MIRSLVLFSLFAYCLACEYTLTVTNYKKCDKKEGITVDKVTAKLNDKCNLQITGCAKLTKPFKALEIKYKGIKNGIPVITGTKKGCGFKYEDFEVKCPIPPPKEYCAQPNWEFEIPKQALGMAVGKLKGAVDVVADGKEHFCFEGNGEIKKK